MKKRSFLDIFGREKALHLIEQTTRAAARDALNVGLPVTFLKGSVLYRRYPDGRVEPRD